MKPLLMIELDADEMTVLIAEACVGLTRVPNMNARQIVELMAGIHPETVEGFQRAAVSLAQYFREQIEKGQIPS